MFQPENYAKRSQDLVKAYHDAGQFYLARTRSVLSLTSSFKDSSMFLLKEIMPLILIQRRRFRILQKNFLNKV